jgi:signal transduction histidine kinase
VHENGKCVAMRGSFQDITERKQAKEKMERALHRQAVVNQLALTLGAAPDLDTIYRTAYQCIHDLMDCEAFIISFYNRETNLLKASYAVTRGAERDVASFPPIPLEEEGHGTHSQVIYTGKPLYVADYYQAMDATETKYKIDEEGNITPGPPPLEEEDSTRSALYVPMKIEGETIGVVQVQSHRVDGYEEEDRDSLGALANVVAMAVHSNRLFESLHQSNQELEAQRADLEGLVAQRTAELSEQVRETGQLNLERISQQLKQANEELEFFSYSVSHDLRAPLRAIDGFSRILQDECAPESQRYLGIIRNNAQQMGQLIDDLLAFSRLSRQILNKQPVSSADLARQVLEELAQEYEGRQVELIIGDLPMCQADPSLLRQVYINLLSNALKYTRERETARIEIGTAQISDFRSQIANSAADQSEISDLQSAIYYVRDNGVGFDMRYADKLFGVFQRLHHPEDYEGTGVGLAIVQRIIRRHGGRVWAEAEVDKGATFYFTI